MVTEGEYFKTSDISLGFKYFNFLGEIILTFRPVSPAVSTILEGVITISSISTSQAWTVFITVKASKIIITSFIFLLLTRILTRIDNRPGYNLKIILRITVAGQHPESHRNFLCLSGYLSLLSYLSLTL